MSNSCASDGSDQALQYLSKASALGIYWRMKTIPLSERVSEMIPNYERLFAGRGDVSPLDPLEFHLYHLARYWSRLVGFSRQYPLDPVCCINGDLGACVQVGSEFTHKMIGVGSPCYELWQECWTRTQTVLYERPVTIETVETASRAFDAYLAGIKYNPWVKPCG